MIDPKNTGLYVPTTLIYDVTELYKTDINTQEFKELLVRLYQTINVISLTLNRKVNGYYPDQEFNSGKEHIPQNTTAVNYTPGYIVEVQCGALPNAGTTSTPHGLSLNQLVTAIDITGAATNPNTLQYISLPYISTTGNTVQVDINATDIVITTTTNMSGYTISRIIFEFIRQ